MRVSGTFPIFGANTMSIGFSQNAQQIKRNLLMACRIKRSEGDGAAVAAARNALGNSAPQSVLAFLNSSRMLL
jgi:hypothetical protein